MNTEELKQYLNGKSEIITTPVTKDYFSITRNWYESLKNVNCDHLALVICLDEDCYNLTKEYNIPSILSIYNIQKDQNQTIKDWRVHEKNVKVFDTLDICEKNNLNIITSEVDVIFLKNPIEKLKQEVFPDYDCCCLSDRRFNDFYAHREHGIDTHIDRKNGIIRKYGKSYDVEYGIQNFAISYIPHSEKNINFWKTLVSNPDYFSLHILNQEKDYDDETFQTVLIKTIKDHQLKVKILSPFEFPNGTVWDISYLRNRLKDTAYLVHHNTSEGNTPEESMNMKIEKMKEYGHWYID